jgi:hypothetical protein
VESFLGLIPVLKKVLISAHEQGITRRAVLCAEGVCHIRSSRGFDNGKYNSISGNIRHPVETDFGYAGLYLSRLGMRI